MQMPSNFSILGVYFSIVWVQLANLSEEEKVGKKEKCRD
jgi:hypothetical protein